MINLDSTSADLGVAPNLRGGRAKKDDHGEIAEGHSHLWRDYLEQILGIPIPEVHDGELAGKAAVVQKATELGVIDYVPRSWREEVAGMSDIDQELHLDYDAEERREMAANGQAMRDGSFPIKNRSDLKKAVRLWGHAKNPDAAKRHIIKRARALGLADTLPEDWNLKNDRPAVLDVTLMLEPAQKAALIQEEINEQGVMRVKVPFYVGGTVAQAPGFTKKIHFPAEILSETVRSGNATIEQGLQPLTVYARHSHAATRDYLPIGAAVTLQSEGRTGYAVIDIAPTALGKDTQVLIQNKMLNAVSLRSKDYDVREVKINGEAMLEVTRLGVTGIDFAPDGPAQPTFGIEVLAAEAVIEPDNTHKEDNLDLTLETLRRDHAPLVSQIEAPHIARVAEAERERDSAKARVTELEQENANLKASEAKRAVSAKLDEMAQKFPDPKRAREIFQDLCKDCTTEAEVAVKLLPFLMESMKGREIKTPTPIVTKPAEQLVQELFGNKGHQPEHTDEPEGETVLGLELPD